MTSPRLVRLALLLIAATASAHAEGLLPRENAGGEGCAGALRGAAALGSGERATEVIYHDGSHAPVSVPLSTPGEGPAPAAAHEPAAAAAATPAASAPTRLPSAEPARPRSSPRWQTFLPGSLK